MPKILVIRFSSIGDIVLTSPVVRCIKKQFPGTEIHFLVKKTYEELLAHNPNIDRVITFENDLWQTIRQVKGERYDFILDLHHNLRSLLVTFQTKARISRFKKLNFYKWLMVNFKRNMLPNVHVVDRFFEAALPAGIENDGLGLDFYFKPGAAQVVDNLPAIFKNGFIAFAIGANHQTKKLPSEKIISICKKLKHPVVLLGGFGDQETGEKISAACGTQVFNACGIFTVSQSAAVIKNSRLVITHDTGMMHIAASFQKKILSVWGNTIPAFGMYPYYGRGKSENETRFEISNLKCRPCSKIGFRDCPENHFNCMQLQDENKIAAAANSIAESE